MFTRDSTAAYLPFGARVIGLSNLSANDNNALVAANDNTIVAVRAAA